MHIYRQTICNFYLSNVCPKKLKINKNREKQTEYIHDFT